MSPRNQQFFPLLFNRNSSFEFVTTKQGIEFQFSNPEWLPSAHSHSHESEWPCSFEAIFIVVSSLSTDSVAWSIQAGVQSRLVSRSPLPKSGFHAFDCWLITAYVAVRAQSTESRGAAVKYQAGALRVKLRFSQLLFARAADYSWFCWTWSLILRPWLVTPNTF